MRIKEVVQHKPHLFLDMDGVQADFFTAWARLFGKEQYKDIGDRAQREVSIADINSRGPEFVEAFFTNLPVLPGAQTLIKFLRDNKIDYTILSAPLRGNEEASIRGKLAWLDRHHPGSSATAIFTGEKQRYATTNGKPNVLVDDFKKYVNAWTADGGIAVLYRWNNVGAAIEQLKKIYRLEPDARVNSLDALQEAVVGTLYPKKILGTARVGDLSIPIHRHLYDQAQRRGIDIKTIERTLRRLPRIASKLKKIEAGNKVWVYNPHDEISLGFFALDSGGYLLNTVIPNAPHQQGVTDVIRMYEENFADGSKFVKPNFDFEWEEAARYPEFVKLGKDAWIKLARKGKAITINSAQDINNTDAADPDSFKLLAPEKQKRALAQLETGTIEMPIVAVYSDGHKELVGGNTRLTAMMARDGRATVWAFRVPGKQGVAEATGDEKFDAMMGRIATEPKVPDIHPDMPPTSIPELLQWAKENNKPYHYKFADWARKHNFTNVNAALMWFGDNVDPWDEFGPKDHLNVFGDLVGEPLIDAAKHNPKAAELLKVFASYEKIYNDWTDEYRQMKEQGVAEDLNEFALDGFNGGEDGDEFSPEIAKMAQEDGFTKGASLADGATLERAITINHWHSQHGGMYRQYFAKGFRAGRLEKIRHNNKQYNLNLKLMKDGSIRHGEPGVAENFADGKVKGKSRPGRVKRAGASCDGSVTSLRQRAKNASGERARMYHWCANMKSGRKK